jgi:hypothetical protein
MGSPKPYFVDVSNQVGQKSIIWQYLWQDKESENSECQLCKEKNVSKILYTGNALARVQQVHALADLWDITFCTR